jgi:hypothetical protein|eukprot:COSAG02_NODE_244_length_27402_cov_41.050397_7_plen_47_part_00
MLCCEQLVVLGLLPLSFVWSAYYVIMSCMEQSGDNDTDGDKDGKNA